MTRCDVTFTRGALWLLEDLGILYAEGRVLRLTMTDGTARVHEVPCYGPGSDLAVLIERPGVRAAWGTFPDGLRVVYVFDVEDDGFGYAFNVDWVDGSEWGYAPIGGTE